MTTEVVEIETVKSAMRSAVIKSLRAIAERLMAKYAADHLTGAEMAEVLEKTARDMERRVGNSQ